MFGSSKLQHAAIVALILVVSGTQGIASTWSTSSGWSSTSNPSGTWTYGYLPSLTGIFAAYGAASQNAEGEIRAWSSDNGGTTNGCAIKNVSSSSVTIGDMNWSPGQTSVHPGVRQPSLGTFRWTAPVTTMVQVTSAFSGIDATGVTTDVHVLKNGVSLFDGEVDGFAGNPSILAFGSSPVTGETILLTIDTCASGGRRIDLETPRRSVPLLRSDDQCTPVDNQLHTCGQSAWVPFHCTGGYLADTYTIRSCMCPGFAIGIDVRGASPDHYAFARKMEADWRQMAGYFLGDYYPPIACSAANDVWMAWQFDAPEKGEGMVQAFKRAQSPDASVCLKLHGLDLDSVYAVTDLDTGLSQPYTGRDLIRGLTISVQTVPCAKIFTYRKTH